MSLRPDTPIDVAADVRLAATGVTVAASGASMTSDLSIDEEFNLHAIGWEPVELVSGVSVVSIPAGMWNWGQGEITGATEAHALAFKNAITRLEQEASTAGGQGVVGVHIERNVHSTHVEISLLGTAYVPSD